MEALADDLNVAKALGQLFTTVARLEKAPERIEAETLQSFERVMFALGFLLKTPA